MLAVHSVRRPIYAFIECSTKGYITLSITGFVVSIENFRPSLKWRSLLIHWATLILIYYFSILFWFFFSFFFNYMKRDSLDQSPPTNTIFDEYRQLQAEKCLGIRGPQRPCLINNRGKRDIGWGCCLSQIFLFDGGIWVTRFPFHTRGQAGIFCLPISIACAISEFFLVFFT